MSRSDTELGPPEAPPALARRRLRRRAEAVKRAQLERALTDLEDRGGLTDEQREVVEDLASGIVRELLAGPESALERAPRTDRDDARAVVRLFDLEDETRRS